MERSTIKPNLDLNEFNFSIVNESPPSLDQYRLESLRDQIRTEGTFIKR